MLQLVTEDIGGDLLLRCKHSFLLPICFEEDFVLQTNIGVLLQEIIIMCIKWNYLKAG